MCSSLLTVSALLTPPPRIATSSNSLLSTKFEQLQSDYGDDGARCLWRHLRTGRDPCLLAHDQGGGARSGLGARARAAIASAYKPLSGVADVVSSLTTSDGTRKLLLRLHDGHEVETVLIPPIANAANPSANARARSTLCVSSQVGCRQGCRFCATGTMGLFRSLTLDEILAQVFAARALVASSDELPPLSNLVFMGMGEPADNAAVVRRAVDVLCDGRRFGFSPTKVTVSTVAPTANAFSALLLGDGGDDAAPVPALAWSLHAADAARKQLVPTAVDSPEALRDGLCATLAALPPRRRKVMVEYVLLGGCNDRPADADDLAAFLRPIEAACADPPARRAAPASSSTSFRSTRRRARSLSGRAGTPSMPSRRGSASRASGCRCARRAAPTRARRAASSGRSSR